MRTYLNAAKTISADLYVRACELIIGERRREQGRPTPGDLYATAMRLKEAEQRERGISKTPSEDEMLDNLLAEIRSGQRRWYVEEIVNRALEMSGYPPIRVPEWPIAPEMDRARWEREMGHVRKEFVGLLAKDPVLGKKIANLAVPGLARNLPAASQPDLSL